ncbi:hypothetical protein, partial [Donghicola tyrosinivorans]|uniref:hypothetical protein n=1 Tax=Donghicola tyrosinivorans TaxID=1652492 RepID=UPI001B805F24
LNSSLCPFAISVLLFGKIPSQRNGTNPWQVQSTAPRGRGRFDSFATPALNLWEDEKVRSGTSTCVQTPTPSYLNQLISLKTKRRGAKSRRLFALASTQTEISSWKTYGVICGKDMR